MLAAVGLGLGLAEGIFAAVEPLALPRFLGWTVNPSLPYRVKISGVVGSLYPPHFHPHFFWAVPTLYVLVILLFALVAAAALASLAPVAGVWVRQPLLALAMPTIVFFLGDAVTQALAGGHLVPSVYAGA